MRRKPAAHSPQMTSPFLMTQEYALTSRPFQDGARRTARTCDGELVMRTRDRGSLGCEIASAEGAARHLQQARPFSCTGGQGTDP